MADTTFVPGTPIVSTWLNDVNRLTYDLSSIATIAKGDALVGVKRTFTSATATTQHAVNEWREINVVTDCGADPTGVADSTAAFQAAINANRNIFVPAGTYKFASGLTVSSGRKGLTIRGEYGLSKLEATFAGAILTFPSGVVTQYTLIEGLTFQASGAGDGAATGIAGTTTLAYVMLIDIRNCQFSGSLRYGCDGNFLMAFWTRNAFGSDRTPTGGKFFKPLRLRATDSFMSTLMFDSNQINSGNDDCSIELQWGYSVTFRGKNDFEGAANTDCVIKVTDILGLNFDDAWGESNTAIPFTKLYDGAHPADMRVVFNNLHYEGVGAGANDTLIDTQNSAGGLYSLKNSVIQDLTHISRSASGYDIGAQCLALENNKAAGVTPVFIETPSHKGTITNNSAPTGSVGERIVGTQFTATNFPATTTYGDGTSISLTAGDWDVTLQCNAVHNGATMTGAAIFGISTTTGNSGAGLQGGDNEYQMVPTATLNPGGSISNYRVQLTATTTYYAKVRADYSAGNPQYRLRLTARRIR